MYTHFYMRLLMDCFKSLHQLFFKTSFFEPSLKMFAFWELIKVLKVLCKSIDWHDPWRI